jgi:hypothetical protein
MMDPENERAPRPHSLAGFITTLVTSGEVAVSSDELTVHDDQAALVALANVELQTREELSGPPPPFNPAVALWAAHQFYHASRFLVCRDIPAAEVTRQLKAPCPESRRPETDYTVDLIFRFLPDLLNFAERSASEDALTAELRDWAYTWPLSSVGSRISRDLTIESFVDSPVLLQLYADRIVQHAAVDRLGDPRVLTRVRADLGAHPELAPAFASKLQLSTLSAQLP